MKNCNCKETTTQCNPNPCDFVYKMPVDECTNKVVYYITLASAVLMSCNDDKTVEQVLEEIKNKLTELDYITNNSAWQALIEKIKAHISDLNPELTTLIDNRIGEIINLDELIDVFNTLFEEWKDLLNDLISQASTIVLDDNVTENSSNGVKSSGIYAAINNLPLPDWDEDIPTLHSHILNKPTKLSDFENDLEPFHIGFATSSFDGLLSNLKATVEFEIKAKNFIGTGVWSYEDAAAMASAIRNRTTDTDYEHDYTHYIGILTQSGDHTSELVNEVINYILNLKYYPVLITPKNENSFPESGVYYDLNTELFFNLIKDLNGDYKARYLKRGPAITEGQIMVIGAIESNVAWFLEDEGEENKFKSHDAGVPCFGFDDSPTIRICTGIDYMSVGDGTYHISNLQQMNYEFIEVENVSKTGNLYTGVIHNAKLTMDGDLYQLSKGSDTFNIIINSLTGSITLTPQNTNNEP